MSAATRVAITFGAPLLLLGAAAMTAWLALGDAQSSFGPMRLTPLPRRSETQSLSATGNPPPTTLEPLSPVQAEERNALLPYSSAPLLAGAGFAAGRDDATTASQCMTQAIYYEAGNEPDAGKRAVAQVILNRVASPAFPKSVCAVVQQGASRPGCQFTFMCDGSLSRPPAVAGWTRAHEIAEDALKGYIDTTVGAATHYHADYVFPTWAPTMVKLAKVGRHIFYRWPGAQMAMAAPAAAEPAAPADTPSADSPPPILSEPAPTSSAAIGGAMPTALASAPIFAPPPVPSPATTAAAKPIARTKPPLEPPAGSAPHRAVPETRMRD